jgi:dihydropteroate synthase
MDFSSRKIFDWHLRTRKLSLGRRTVIMGILNVTPDSFSDGGTFSAPDAALTRALEMLEEGADIIDIGGESTRPNATPLSAHEEQARILPVIQATLKRRPDALISVDTYHSETARLAVEAGAEIVNDVSGHLWDPEMAATCAELGCGAVLMHTRGKPGEWKSMPPLAQEEVLPLVFSGLKLQAERAAASGVAPSRMAIDPGFGFGKIRGENYPLLASLHILQALGFPLIVGLSRKSFLRVSNFTSLQPEEQKEVRRTLLPATLAANTAAILQGAHVIRVHDVAEARAAADVADAILSAATTH